MVNEVAHLNDEAKAALQLNNEERIARIRGARWIGYTRAKQILDTMEELLTHPKQHRMPNLLIYGDTNNGKTMLVNRFRQLHMGHDNPEGEGIILPVLIIQCPSTPDEHRFYNAILEKLFAPYKSSDKVDKKLFQVIKLLEMVRLEMLILDELHNLIAGNMNKQRQFLNTLKFLGNELQIPFVGVGTEEARVALQTDPQLANRFEPMKLPRWTMGEDYLRLLASFERMLPLKKPSQLTETNLAIKLLSMSEGILGELSSVLNKTAVKAVKSGKEQITIELLNSIKWIQPSKRK